MSRWNRKRKLWQIRHSKKNNKRKPQKHAVLKRKNNEINATYTAYRNNQQVLTLCPPSCFSLTDNTEETMDFFIGFVALLERKKQGVHFIIDSSKVEKVTVDALIYLIAILQNDGMNNTMRYTFSGNYPNNKEAFKVYAESGFNNYVVSKMKKLPDSNDRMCITCGIQNDSATAKELSDFVMLSLNKTRKDIQPIQKVLIELMSNVYHHAYEKNTFMAKKWYMYAEHVEDYVRCIFVDTGFGIAKTARKNFGEILKSFFSMELDDSRIIESIFNGDFRTATKEKYRGNGLSSVRKNVSEDIFEGFEVISGSGRCVISKKQKDNIDKIYSTHYNKKLYGTLFQFIVR